MKNNNSVNNKNKERAESAIDKKAGMRLGIWTMAYIFYMMFGFGTVCPEGYVEFDAYKWVLFVAGAVIYILGVGVCCLPKLDKSFKGKFKLSIVDVLVLGTLLSWLIGCSFAVDKRSAFLGDNYRNTGFFYVGLIVFTGWLVSKYAKHHFAVSIGFAVWTMVTNVVGIMQYYAHDPFNWQIYRQFTGLRSMFGNCDQYAAMCAIYLVVLIAIFILEKNLPTVIITGIAIVIDTIGGFSADSAGFFFAAFGVLVLIGFALRDSAWLRKLWMSAVMVYAGLLIQRHFYDTTDDWQSMNEQLTRYIFENRKIVIGIGIMIAVLGIMVFLLKPVIDKAGVWISRAWFILFGIALIAAAGVIIYANKNQANIAEEAFLYKFVINDRFGSGRGEIWKEVLRIYGESGIKDKLFGIGFDNISRLKLLTEVYGPLNQTLADAHCVYLDMLLTCGILGAGLYFSLIIVIIVRCVKYVKECPGVVIACVAAATYLAVALINFNMNIFLPTCFMVMVYGLSFTKDAATKESIKETVSESE